MPLSKVAGAKLYIGSRVAYKSLINLTDFANISWTEVAEWVSTGDLGVEQEMLTQTLISNNITLYAKGPISFPIMENQFSPVPSDPGQTKLLLAQKSCKPFAFKIEWGADCAEESTVTISNSPDAEVTWVAHGLPNGTPVVFSTTGALPTGLTAGTTYYVVDADTDKFSVATTPGGSAISTSSAGSGIHTAVAQPIEETNLFYAFAMYGTRTGGEASATRLINVPLQLIAVPVTV